LVPWELARKILFFVVNLDNDNILKIRENPQIFRCDIHLLSSKKGIIYNSVLKSDPPPSIYHPYLLLASALLLLPLTKLSSNASF
jgi:hypothetical protein